MSAKPDKPTFKAEEAIVSAVYAIAIVGAYCWIFYGFAGRDLGTIVLVFGVPVLAFTSTVIHEAGHAIGALIAGWRPIVVSAWPFAWHIPNNAIVIFGKGSGYDGGGYVAGVPRSLRQNTRARFGVFVAAGPLTSLVLAIALI